MPWLPALAAYVRNFVHILLRAYIKALASVVVAPDRNKYFYNNRNTYKYECADCKINKPYNIPHKNVHLFVLANIFLLPPLSVTKKLKNKEDWPGILQCVNEA